MIQRGVNNKGISIRVLAILLALFMIISGISAAGTDTFAKDKSQDTSSFTVSIPDGAMVKGDTKTITVSPKKVKVKSYKSSNKKVLKVTSKGKLKALKKGSAKITVTAKNGAKSTIVVKVFDKKSDMVVDRKINGKKGLWHIKSGKVVKKTGFATDGISWFYVKKGKVSKTTGIIKGSVNGETAKWYVKKGKVQLSCTDYIYFKGYTYKVKDGRAGDRAKGKLDAFFGDEVEIKKGKTKVIGDEKISFRLDDIYSTGNYGGTFIEDGKEIAVSLMIDKCPFYVQCSKFIKDYDIEFINRKSDSVFIKIIKHTKEVKKPMEISGKASDHYTTTDYEYIESDNIIMFIPKGYTFDGNVLVKFEEYMKSVEKNMGLKRKWHDVSYEGFEYMQDYVYGTNVFEGVDPDIKKVHIYICDKHPSCMADRETYPCIYMDQHALDVNAEYLETTFIHEYTHFVHLTNGPSFNPIMNEGYAAYIEMMTAKEYVKLSDEQFNDDYYFIYFLKRGELTEANAEKIFIEGYPDGPNHSDQYNYGCIFMEYLHQTYGKNAFLKLFDEGDVLLKKQIEETGMCDLSGESTAKLLKKTYSDNIFKDFIKWVDSHPEYTREPIVIDE